MYIHTYQECAAVIIRYWLYLFILLRDDKQLYKLIVQLIGNCTINQFIHRLQYLYLLKQYCHRSELWLVESKMDTWLGMIRIGSVVVVLDYDRARAKSTRKWKILFLSLHVCKKCNRTSRHRIFEDLFNLIHSVAKNDRKKE